MLSSQSTIVLINEIPTKVDLNGSEITSINEKVPSYMNGYRNSPKSEFRRIWPGEVVDIKAMVSVDPPVAEESIPEQEEAIRFEESSFVLSSTTKDNLDKLVEQIKTQNSNTVLLKSWYKLGDTGSQELTINRLDACKSYLESKGVQGSIIITSFTGAESQTDFVSSDIK